MSKYKRFVRFILTWICLMGLDLGVNALFNLPVYDANNLMFMAYIITWTTDDS